VFVTGFVRATGGKWPSEISTVDPVLIIGLVAIPMIGYLGAVITNGPFVDRYFLPAIFGVLAATGCLFNRLNRAGIVACGLVLILALGLQEFSNLHPFANSENLRLALPCIDLCQNPYRQNLAVSKLLTSR
jgi:hypothetical protein